MANEATKMLTPEGLANQLFDGALAQNAADPRGAARQVITFLNDALLYAVSSAKFDPVVFMTEALVNVVSAVAPVEADRGAMLKYISDMLASAAQQAPAASAAQQAPAASAAQQAPAGAPVPVKP